MNIFFRRASSGCCLTAVSLSLICAALPSSPSVAATSNRQPSNTQGDVPQKASDIFSATATSSAQGVLLQWQSELKSDNLGFNVYRLQDGQRTKLNGEIVPGSVFVTGEKSNLRGRYSYGFLDRAGTARSTYLIESVTVEGKLAVSESIKASGGDNSLQDPTTSKSTRNTTPLAPVSDGYRASQTEYPSTSNDVAFASGPIEDQWSVAAQPGLKISINREGWYRITQQQAVAAGFNPSVDVGYLLLYADGKEVAILTSKANGPFSSNDSFEFYGMGVDTPTTDTRTYYLIAGTRPGKRVRGVRLGKRIIGGVHIDGTTSSQGAAATPAGTGGFIFPNNLWFGWIFNFLNGLERSSEEPAKSVTEVSIPAKEEPSSVPAKEEPSSVPAKEEPTNNSAKEEPSSVSGKEKPSSVPAKEEPTNNSATEQLSFEPEVKPKKKSKRKTTRRKKKTQREYSHASVTVTSVVPSFDATVERKDRLVYFSSLLNGDVENYFGQVISSVSVTQNLTTPNPETTASSPAKLQVALQGVSFVTHQINVIFNDAALGTITFFGHDHPVQTFDLPSALLHNGNNTLKFVSVASGSTSIVDYARLTYRRVFKADNNSLRFSLATSDAARIDGFSAATIQIIDYTDPFSVRITKPLVESSGSGYAATVLPAAGREVQRLLYAINETDADQPAGLSFNEPSTLNLSTNAADLLIITHKDLIPSLSSLVGQRQSQGMMVSVADVEDIYDEFSYGAHGPQAIKNFLSRAATSWTKAPRYVLLAGDASLDPRNYEGLGDLDLVPTKLIDATYNETSSDDWLSDFDNDGLAEIAIGRLPVSTVAQANLVISKIVNFAPANVPPSALLVADDPTGYYFNFELANDEVQSLLPSSIFASGVQRVNRRTDANARTNVIAKLNSGQALVNYTGHGNVDTWTGASIFTSADALALTNGNKLSFVVVMDCLNGYFQDPRLAGLAEALTKAPNGGSIAVFASSGLTLPDGPHAMSKQLYILLYGSPSISPALGDAIKTAKTATTDIDVRRTWILFGDPSMKIR